MRSRGNRPAAFVVVLGLLPGLLLLGSLCGCGDDNPYQTVKVSGKVTYDDGSPIQTDEIMLMFDPQVEALDAKTHPRTATATVNAADGTFSSATTYEYGDGLIVGTHKVAVQPMKDGVLFSGPVPDAYLNAATSPLEITVQSGMEPLELKVPKP